MKKIKVFILISILIISGCQVEEETFPYTFKERLKVKDLNAIISNSKCNLDLNRIKSLDLSNQNIKNGKFLSSFKGIEILKLRNNKIEDIQFLKSLKKLRYLDIGKNIISEKEILKNNKNLEYAFLDGNPIKRNIHTCPTDFELKNLNITKLISEN